VLVYLVNINALFINKQQKEREREREINKKQKQKLIENVANRTIIIIN
jgi:hypothetical protein